MRTLAILPLLSLLAGAAAADDLTETEGAVLRRILSVVQIDLIADSIGQERAILMRSAAPDDDLADLVILAGEPDQAFGETLLVARHLVWAGQMAGQVPWLEISDHGSLLVRSEQIGIGRSPWEETLTLAERDGEVRVAGFTFNQWDRLTVGTSVCDWNLLTGAWTMKYEVPSETGPGRKGETSGQRQLQIPVTEWSVEGQMLPDFCQVDLAE